MGAPQTFHHLHNTRHGCPWGLVLGSRRWVVCGEVCLPSRMSPVVLRPTFSRGQVSQASWGPFHPLPGNCPPCRWLMRLGLKARTPHGVTPGVTRWISVSWPSGLMAQTHVLGLGGWVPYGFWEPLRGCSCCGPRLLLSLHLTLSPSVLLCSLPPSGLSLSSSFSFRPSFSIFPPPPLSAE